MSREDLERLLDEGARDYNDPPPTPREPMWAAIRRELDRPERAGARELARRRARARGRGRWTPWVPGLAAAAILAAGFGLGRMMAPASLVPPHAPALTTAERSSLPVRLETARHMGEAEAMLTLFRASDREADRDAMSEWARELLVTTRLLLDSRAGGDPRMAQLLGDLELVLVQIVNEDIGLEDRELIEEGIEQRQLIAKLRAVAGDALEMAM